jgi:hypothetical protein
VNRLTQGDTVKRKLIFAGIVAMLLVLPGPAAAAEKGAKKDDPAHVREDIANHRAMAEAHLNAAKCLEAGKTEKQCHAQLAKDCKGLGIGKYCGMKHRH